jgi:hypothetical protein
MKAETVAGRLPRLFPRERTARAGSAHSAAVERLAVVCSKQSSVRAV